MRLPSIVVALSLLAVPVVAAADARVHVAVDRKSGRALYRFSSVKAPLHVVASELARTTNRRITVDTAARNAVVTVVATDATEDRMLEAIASQARVWVVRRGDVVRFLASEPTATVDVKDEDVRVILKSMQEQCGIRNLVIDPNVAGKGTFLFRDVPCRQAFSVVLSTFGLSGDFSGTTVATVSTRR